VCWLFNPELPFRFFVLTSYPSGHIPVWDAAAVAEAGVVAGALAGAGAAAVAVADAVVEAGVVTVAPAGAGAVAVSAAVVEAGVVAGPPAAAGAAAGVEAIGADVVDLNGTGSILMHVVQFATCAFAPISSWPVNVQQPFAMVVVPTS